MKTYYKVLKYDYASARSSYAIQYHLGEFVKAEYEGTPLCVFDSLENARLFHANGVERIYECEVKGIYRKPWIPFYTTAVGDIIEKTSKQSWLYGYYNIPKLISDKIKQHKKISHLVHTNLPKGTVCVREVKLVKKVG